MRRGENWRVEKVSEGRREEGSNRGKALEGKEERIMSLLTIDTSSTNRPLLRWLHPFLA